MAVVISLYAIIGVTFYDSRSPEDFGNLRCVSGGAPLS